MASESVDLVWSSPPYGTQYEYVAAVEDFGHNDDNDAFWRQMDYLTPELHRILKPGRLCVFHTKDRIRFGNMNGRGYATVQPFAAEAIMHMIKHGFGFMGEITLDTDVVRENNQTYRLGWSEVVKDRTKLGVGTPEKILLFRKNQTDRTTGAADDPVVKTKEQYTLARWQIDAAAFWKSSGDRFITPEELEGLPVPMIRKVFAAACESRIYDYEAHVALGDDFAGRGRLPTTFAMLAPTTESPVIWTEVNRLQSLNTSQAQKGRELHVCPTPTDVLDRCINQWSNPGDLIYDPFGGLGSCVVRALALGRRGKCTELNPLYWGDAVKYAQAMENKVNMPSLFDVLDELSEPAA
jgi:DNA modification methylase